MFLQAPSEDATMGAEEREVLARASKTPREQQQAASSESGICLRGNLTFVQKSRSTSVYNLYMCVLLVSRIPRSWVQSISVSNTIKSNMIFARR